MQTNNQPVAVTSVPCQPRGTKMAKRDDPEAQAALLAFAGRLKALVDEKVRGAETRGDKRAFDRLALDLDTSPVTLKSYTEARREPGALVLRRLAEGLGVSSDYLLGITDDPRPCSEQLAERKAS